MKVISIQVLVSVCCLVVGVQGVPHGKLPARLTAGAAPGTTAGGSSNRGGSGATAGSPGNTVGGATGNGLPTTSTGVAPVASLPTNTPNEGTMVEIPPSPDGSHHGEAADTSGVDPTTFFDNEAVSFIANHPHERQDFEQVVDRLMDPDSSWMSQMQENGLDEHFMDAMEALGTREQFETMAKLNIDVHIKHRMVAGGRMVSDQLNNVLGEFRTRYKGTRGMSTATWTRVRRAMSEGLRRDWERALENSARTFRDESTRGYTAIGAGIAAAAAAQLKDDGEEEEEEGAGEETGEAGADVGQKHPRNDKDDDEGSSSSKRICRGDLQGHRI